MLIISATGVLSLDFSKSYEIINPYGDSVKMYGAGIYARDTYFAATLFIGTDFMILFLFVPLFIWTYICSFPLGFLNGFNRFAERPRRNIGMPVFLKG